MAGTEHDDAPTANPLYQPLSSDQTRIPAHKRSSTCLPDALMGMAVLLLAQGLIAGLVLFMPMWHQRLLKGFDQAIFLSECMHPMGGGMVARGGGFKPLNDTVVSQECAAELQMYFSKQEGQYFVDVARVAEAAREYFDSLAVLEPPSAHKLIVFDIDETTLSNAAEWQRQLELARDALGKGLRRASQQGQGGPRAAPGAALADGLRLGKARTGTSDRPPLAPMLALYQYLYSAGYSVAFVTGRKEFDRNSTETNLLNAGYGRICKAHGTGGLLQGAGGRAGKGSSAGQGVSAWEVEAAARPSAACYVALHLRELDDDRFASVYKPERRGVLISQGYSIYGSFGDQFSDLDGEFGAPHSFKLPNPSYLIL